MWCRSPCVSKPRLFVVRVFLKQIVLFYLYKVQLYWGSFILFGALRQRGRLQSCSANVGLTLRGLPSGCIFKPEKWICTWIWTWRMDLFAFFNIAKLPSSARGGISTSKRSPGQLGIALRAPPKDAIGCCQHRLPGRVWGLMNSSGCRYVRYCIVLRKDFW